MTDHLPPKNYIDDINARLLLEKDDLDLFKIKTDLLNQMNWKKYAYNFTWFGRPIIQIPQDTMTFQEMIWEIKPDLIIETGIAHGGSIIFSASMLALLEAFGMVENPLVVGLDIDIREHNRLAIEQHPAFQWIKMIEGSSVDEETINHIENIAKTKERVMVFLDSDHSHSHVLSELRAYAPLVSIGSFCVVLDTGVEDIDPSAIAEGRTWGKGNSPKSALNEFLSEDDRFMIDEFYHNKAWVTSAPAGFIKRIK